MSIRPPTDKYQEGRTKKFRVCAIAALGLTACGAAAAPGQASPPVRTTAAPAQTTTPGPTTTVDAASVGRQYLALAATTNAAQATFFAKVTANPSATGAQMAPWAAPYIASMKALDQGLLDLAAPAATTPDVKAVVAANSALIVDLKAIDGLTLLNLAAWSQQVQVDGGKQQGTVTILRHDLGLPPR